MAGLTHFLFSVGGEKLALVERRRLTPPALAVGWLVRALWAITSPPEREGGILPQHSARI